ncbi:hypothetical protein GCM10028821_18840 [Hymenobacter jeollabukensis]
MSIFPSSNFRGGAGTIFTPRLEQPQPDGSGLTVLRITLGREAGGWMRGGTEQPVRVIGVPLSAEPAEGGRKFR